MFRKADILVLLLSLAAVVGVGLVVLGGSAQARTVTVIAPGGKFIYSLSEDRVIQVRGLTGESVIEVRDGQVRFLESACPNHLCLAGSISRPGEYLACLPNSVMVVIGGAPSKEVDDVSF